MSKNAILAAALIGAGLGFDNHMCDHTSNMVSDEDIRLYSEAAYYAPIAAAMVEAAHDITFQYPEDWKWNIYRAFGEEIGDHTGQNEANEGLDEDDEGYDEYASATVELPDRPTMLDVLETLVYTQFMLVTSAQNQQKLRTAIAQARAETA